MNFLLYFLAKILIFLHDILKIWKKNLKNEYKEINNENENKIVEEEYIKSKKEN
jgi:hypothetical protein